MTVHSALLLVGSPRGPESTSDSLGNYLLDRMHERGVASKSIWIQQALKTRGGHGAMLEEIDAADVVVLSSPLYIDSLPADVMKALEAISQGRLSAHQAAPAFAAIVNSGFPESQHNDTALAICKRFCDGSHMNWAGGLGLGGGASIGGRPLATAGGMFRNVRASLDLAAEALSRGEVIPPEAVSLMSKKFVPAWLYMLLSSIGWRRQARAFGAQKRMREHPYQGPS